jgi:hypothetical protein
MLPDCCGVIGRPRHLLPLLAAVFPAAAGAGPDWSAYERVLEAYVQPAELNGVRLNAVDYTGLRDEPAFEAAVETLEEYPVSRLETRDETLSFYINAYNILAIKMVLDHRPEDSIRDIGSWFRPVWKRPAGRIGGERVTLHEIEHEVLREMDEPRIHFAIVCASISCPDLAREPYRAAGLDRQLDRATQRFLADPAKGLRRADDRIRVSKIFDWFEQDFESAGGVRAFIGRYEELSPDTPLEADLPYDWGLNADPHSGG